MYPITDRTGTITPGTGRIAPNSATARIAAVIPDLDHDTTPERIQPTPGTTAAKLHALAGLDFDTAAARITTETDKQITIRHVAIDFETDNETDELHLNALIHMPSRTVLYAHLHLDTTDERGHQDDLSMELPADHPMSRLAAASTYTDPDPA